MTVHVRVRWRPRRLGDHWRISSIVQEAAADWQRLLVRLGVSSAVLFQALRLALLQLSNAPQTRSCLPDPTRHPADKTRCLHNDEAPVVLCWKPVDFCCFVTRVSSHTESADTLCLTPTCPCMHAAFKASYGQRRPAGAQWSPPLLHTSRSSVFLHVGSNPRFL